MADLTDKGVCREHEIENFFKLGKLVVIRVISSPSASDIKRPERVEWESKGMVLGSMRPKKNKFSNFSKVLKAETFFKEKIKFIIFKLLFTSSEFFGQISSPITKVCKWGQEEHKSFTWFSCSEVICKKVKFEHNKISSRLFLFSVLSFQEILKSYFKRR